MSKEKYDIKSLKKRYKNCIGSISHQEILILMSDFVDEDFDFYDDCMTEMHVKINKRDLRKVIEFISTKVVDNIIGLKVDKNKDGIFCISNRYEGL